MSTQADVAKNLRKIEDMATRLEQRAVDRAGAKDMPGGDAMVALAGVGSIRDWMRRVDIAEEHGTEMDISNEDPDEFWPALQILWWWTEDYRQRLNHHSDDPRWRPTLISEAAFLRHHDVAEWIWSNEVNYDDFAKDVGRAKSKLENILVEGDRSEKTPVVCDKCADKRPLVRVYDEAEVVGWMCHFAEGDDEPIPADAGEDPCPVCEKPAPHVEIMASDPDADRWKCMGCKHLFTIEELDDARATQMRRSEPKEWVSRAEAIGLLRDMGHQRRTAVALVDAPAAMGWRSELSHLRYVSWPEVWRSHLLALQTAKIRLEDAARAKAHKAMCEEMHPEGCWIPGRGCQRVCPRGSKCEWIVCPVHQPERVSA